MDWDHLSSSFYKTEANVYSVLLSIESMVLFWYPLEAHESHAFPSLQAWSRLHQKERKLLHVPQDFRNDLRGNLTSQKHQKSHRTPSLFYDPHRPVTWLDFASGLWKWDLYAAVRPDQSHFHSKVATASWLRCEASLSAWDDEERP